MLHTVHGEVHGGVEYGQQAVYREDTAGEREECGRWGHVLNSVIGLGKDKGEAGLHEGKLYEYGKCTTSLCTMRPDQGERPKRS